MKCRRDAGRKWVGAVPSGAAPDMRATTSKGSLTAAPKMETVAEVTASPMKEKAAITTGKPMACPVSWSRWLRAYLAHQ